MTLRLFMLSLMTSTALTTAAVAQTGPPVPPADAPAQGAAPAPATPAVAPSAQTATPPVVKPTPNLAAPVPPVAAAPAKPVVAAPAAATPSAQPPKPAVSTPKAAPADFGAVYAAEPAKPRENVPLAQPGLTASPTDFAEQQNKARAPLSNTTTTTVGAANDAAQASTTSGIGSTPRPVSPGGVSGQDIGGGYMIQEQAKKTRSTVTRDAIDKQSVTANPYQLINLLPGVVQTSNDNTGLNGGDIRVRGFTSDRIGLTIEGMPVNDSGSYSLFPQEYVDAENIGQLSLSQGTPDLRAGSGKLHRGLSRISA